ncbi:unannotated protein [freshwater metagenome]|uniref:Unannotated protein n=1 Tax=freshwater metagenome TaxID=449393 RepID=A0A6J7L6H2_9ZZZZ
MSASDVRRPAAIRSMRLLAVAVSSEKPSSGASPASFDASSKSGLQAPRSACGGAGTVSAQRYMLGLTSLAGLRSFVPCSIAYATPRRSRSE